MMKASHENSCKMATFVEPSRRLNTTNTTTTTAPSNKKTYVPKLTNSEKQLLSDNKGCFKCHSFFVTHCSNNCLAGFPDPSTYKMLSSIDVNNAKHNHTQKPIAALTPSLGSEVD